MTHGELLERIAVDPRLKSLRLKNPVFAATVLQIHVQAAEDVAETLLNGLVAACDEADAYKEALIDCRKESTMLYLIGRERIETTAGDVKRRGITTLFTERRRQAPPAADQEES